MAPLGFVEASSEFLRDGVYDSLLHDDTVYSRRGDMFPVEASKPPVKYEGTSARLHQRSAKKLHVWREVEKTVGCVNDLWAGPGPKFMRERKPCERRAADESNLGAFRAHLNRREAKISVAHGTRSYGSGDALRKLTKCDAGEYRSVGVRPVRLVKQNAGMVDEPYDLGGVDLLDALPPEDRHCFEPGNTGGMECELERALQKTGDDHRWRWVGASRAGTVEYLKLSREKKLWYYLPLAEVRAINAMFFLPKKREGHLRKIIGCVPANNRMKAPPAVKLPGPWQGSRVRVKGHRFWIGDVDVESFFTRIRIPQYLLFSSLFWHHAFADPRPCIG